MLFLSVSLLLPQFSGPKLSDQVKTLLLALEHHVLLSAASQESLEQDDCSDALVVLLPQFFVLGNVSVLVLCISAIDRGVSSQSGLLFLVLFVGGLLGALLLGCELNVLVGLVKGTLVIAILAGKLLSELESDPVDADLASKDFRFLDGEDVMELFEALIT